MPRMIILLVLLPRFEVAASEPPVPSLFTRTEKLITEREQLGDELIKVVENSDQPIKYRHQAMLLLGWMQYAPAIPILIEHIQLSDPDYVSSEPRPDLEYPAIQALADFGNSAVPQILEAAITTRDQQDIYP